MTRVVKRIDDDELYLGIGSRIRIAREVRGMTQGELARILKLERTSVVNIEQGRQRLPIHTLARICKLFKVSYQLIIDGHSRRGPT